MAVFADIAELRLRIKDPLGAIAILSVADAAARLALTTPSRQTAYKQLDTGDYWTYDADLAQWEAKDLLLSDATLGTLIDLYGVAAAAPRAIKDIMAELGQRLYIARTNDGAGATDYQNLATTYRFYKDLAATMEEAAAVDAGTSQGRYGRTRRRPIAGGMWG
ncbi:MAG: hypothetical protein PHS14_08010 [Elusimicrobia bacterium]|nr:hypothetical protein [Elusimicrobiota bacterium]